MPRRKQKHIPNTADSDYTEFLKSLEPITIALAESRLRVDHDRYFSERSMKLSVAWHCEPIDVQDDYFEADANLILRLGPSAAKSKPTVEIDVTFRMHINAPKPINRALVDRFTDSDVRILIWPYFREYVSNATGRMHIPPIMLPLGVRE